MKKKKKKRFVLLFQRRYPGSLKGFGACFKNLLRSPDACELGVRLHQYLLRYFFLFCVDFCVFLQ